MTTLKKIKIESTNEVETTIEAEKIIVPSESTEKEASHSKKRAMEDSQSSRKRFTTAKDRREHLNKNFRNRKGNRDDINRQQDRNNERIKIEDKGDSNESKEPRKPKKKVAVLVGFCGTGYQGMQINRNAKTIEEDLFKAFVAAGAVSKDNSDDPKKVGLMRAARTDKGVHAAGNLISLKMITDIPNVVEKINENLPDQIRMWGFVKVIRSFHAKTLCDSRVYEYLLPTYVFILPEKEFNLVLSNSIQSDTATQKVFVDVPTATSEEMIEKRKYRISQETIEHVRQGFQEYRGTHNYHNYTIGRSPQEKSCNRYIVDSQVSDPKIINDVEWITIKIHGQSFMLHQIRKMVSLIVMIVRTGTPISLIAKTFTQVKINIPKAPALGLLLERPVFDSYNRKARDQGKDVIDYDIYQDQIEKFKDNFIYSKIFEEEIAENTFQNWLNAVDQHTERDYGYLNCEGIIPESSIVKHGERQKYYDQAVNNEQDDDENSDNED
ncbi:pseudouridine synthase [Rhizophagus irregularis DAOM 181602=DAOM 197198]|uniref:Pseudouridine synthase n=2 Tax=Rhizophagus irregularis TaxID=588596 RepID=U9UV17_RHIID|nr:pseudouridine synthase [Rhizophagus irregularis DAOM 181602=DAOM 197198]PKY20306.1 pseudouridine synthase [Rhizophagus irregularis]POG82552.1 pseudouridine synthase [Rhizophagus irregularis DAOM 181602=DAOM 197198]GBC24160.2 pseudouridine synthase [Rhizophagus irregularis DAOM 181602=DAOM 197198]|eukprot:XP_025189418.1 pseudouridine synthase [Rhizophagus irregularis DAOM 181602=DAOM 197198]